jgi:crotonobetainyl-CoA:carnitine CoA-transferase CaiB-like acyl-CoA transferase
VIYCSVSGLGQDGPLSQASGHDINYLAWSGALTPEGGRPREPAVPVADLSGGMAAAFAVCAAVVRQLKTGEGERIDVAMADVVATWTGAVAPQAEGTDEAARGVPGYGTFATADGRYIVLGVLTEDHFWRPLCEVLELAADVAALGFVDRMARVDELQAKITTAIGKCQRDDLVGALLGAGVPVAPVLDRSEMVGLRHFVDRRAVTTEDWADPATGFPVRFVNHPATRKQRPPEIDQHRGQGFAPR